MQGLLLDLSQIIRPTMKCGWWQHEVANYLQGFYRRLINGDRPKLVLMAPPRHGKTEQVTDFLAWVAGKRPNLKTIFASYSDELGVKVNRDLQRIMTSERYVAIFGHRLGETGSGWHRNSNLVEYVHHRDHFATPPLRARSPVTAWTSASWAIQSRAEPNQGRA